MANTTRTARLETLTQTRTPLILKVAMTIKLPMDSDLSLRLRDLVTTLQTMKSKEDGDMVRNMRK